MPLTISLTPGALPSDGDIITNATLRSIAQPTIALEGAIGTATLTDGSVTTAKLAANVLTADTTGRGKMADGFVNAAKIGTDAVTTVKIMDANVTASKLAAAVLTGIGGGYSYAAATMRSITVTSIARSGTTVTATKVAHGFTAGQTVTVSGVTPSGYNATAIIAVPTADTFTYSVAVDPGAYVSGTITAINNEYVLTLAPVPAAYAAGLVVRFKADLANTGPVDVNVNALGVKNLYSVAAAELQVGQVPAGGVVEAIYDGTQFQWRASPVQYSGTAAATLANGVQTFAHGLVTTPRKVRAVLICTTAQAPWAVGDELDIAQLFDSGGSACLTSVWANATNIKVALYDTGLRITSATSTFTTITAGSWKIKVYAEL